MRRAAAEQPALAEHGEDRTMIGARPVRAPRGTTLTARSWQTEAPLRMLMNNLDPDVAERPDDLVIYGHRGRPPRRPRVLRRPRPRPPRLGELRRHRPHPDDARGRRDPARAVRQAGR